MKDGEILALLGPSGEGKTTLIKCIYGLVDLDAGEIIFNKQNVLGPSFNLIPGYPDMKLVSQDYYVLDNHSVEENIKDMLTGFTSEYKEQRSRKILKLLELESIKHLQAKNLSSGQKQRVAIARALTVFPKLILLDEPFSNLDKILKDKLFAFIIHEIQKKHNSVILITHQAEEALKFASRIAVITNGRIAQIGDKNSVYYRPKNLKVAKLLGDYNVIEYKDFEKNSNFYKLQKRTLLRPNQFKISDKKNGDLFGILINYFFNGKCYELLINTKTGKEIIIYSHTQPNHTGDYYFKIT